MSACAADLQKRSGSGWLASLELSFRASASRTFVQRRNHGPLTMQRAFYPEGKVCHVYLLHPPGGIVGTDELILDIDVSANAHALVTTPGASRFYRSNGEIATTQQRLNLHGGALEWFPQPTLYFNGTHARTRTDIALTADAVFIGWDIQCFGRPASREPFTEGSLISRLSLTRNAKPVFTDRLQVMNQRELLQTTGIRGHTVNALMLISPARPALLELVRSLIQRGGCENLAATCLPDLLLVRYLGDCGETAQQQFVDIWKLLRPLVLGRDATQPRIWAT